jgi:hypothetical protein
MINISKKCHIGGLRGGGIKKRKGKKMKRSHPTLDGKLRFEAKKMLTCMITKGNYFLSICKVKN